MKNKIANIAKAIRNSRKAKIVAIIAAVWVALLVGFVGASWMAAKANPCDTVYSRKSAARRSSKQRKQTPRMASGTLPESARTSNPTTPCPTPTGTSQQQPSGSNAAAVPTQDQERGYQVHNTSLVAPEEGQDHPHHQPRAASPAAPNPTSIRVPSVVWVSAVVSPYNRSAETRALPVQGTDISVSLVAQRRSEPGFRPFRRPEENGKPALEPGFKPFRH